MHQYGIDIQTLGMFITTPEARVAPWGTYQLLVSEPQFRMERLEVNPGASTAFKGPDGFESTLWFEEGSGIVEDVAVAAHRSITVPARLEWKLSVKERAVIYVFSGPASGPEGYLQSNPSFDFRDKYWGTIESIVSKAYAAKRMLVKKGKYASLEYHCDKSEGYFIHSGALYLRLRAGRGEDRFFTLRSGNTSFIPRGLMHQRGGLEDTVIIEVSTQDDDRDSFLVEDGQKTPMPGLPS